MRLSPRWSLATGGVLVLAGVAVSGVGMMALQQSGAVPRVEEVPVAELPVVSVPTASRRVSEHRVVQTPALVEIPRIRVRAAVVPLGLGGNRQLRVPANPWRVGWWKAGPKPGERGSAVLVGHRDSRTGPAVFYGLGDLHVGDEIRVTDMLRRTTAFRVRRLQQVSRARFPTSEVYGPVPRPELRLLTCGGEFDRWRKQYADNLIVYASVSEVGHSPDISTAR